MLRQYFYGDHIEFLMASLMTFVYVYMAYLVCLHEIFFLI